MKIFWNLCSFLIPLSDDASYTNTRLVDSLTKKVKEVQVLPTPSKNANEKLLNSYWINGVKEVEEQQKFVA